jgi:acetylornithine deacetylase/succinyl-diaminopimelate desuccinylase-like protein
MRIESTRSLMAIMLAFFARGALLAQGHSEPSPDSVRSAAQRWYRANRQAIAGELITLLSIPNVASDSVNIRRNADTLVAMLSRRGMAARRLELPGSPPAVFGELIVPGATRTVMLYAHYDGQPVRESEWRTPPWRPTYFDGRVEDGASERSTLPDTGAAEWRLHARSASDDKSPIVAMLAALDALRAARIQPAVNVKFFLEGEEEAGSAHLREMLERHKTSLRADLWIFADGPVHQSRRAQVVFGVRGVMGAELTVYGPSRALHSGHYGNWAPNPAALLADLVASLRAPDGRILIPGFLEDVRAPSAAERRAIAEVPPVEDALKRELAIAEAEGGDGFVLERIMRPALNVRGLSSGGVGATAANAIPTVAHASIDFRLVPDQSPARIRRLLEQHARRRGFHVVNEAPSAEVRRRHPRVLQIVWDEGYPATRTALDSPVARALVRVVEETMGAPVIRVPTLGGSLPMHVFGDVLGAPLVVLPMVNHDNNQHAANENLRLQNLWDGIEMFAGVLARIRW